MRHLLIFFMICCWSIWAKGTTVEKIDTVQTAKHQQFTLKKDSTSKVDVRKIDEQAVKNYSKQKDFNYEEVAATDTWWDKFWKAVWRWIGKLFSVSPGPGSISPIFITILKYFLIALAIGIVVFVVFKLLGIDLKFLISKSKTIEVPYEETLENIHEINFDEQLETAIQLRNYRIAVRLLYLKTLKNLSDQQLIVWQPEKTNQAYVAEIHDETRKHGFAKLTQQFEYIWYGEFFIDQQHFDLIRSLFQQFNQKVT